MAVGVLTRMCTQANVGVFSLEFICFVTVRPFRLSKPHMKYIKQCIRWVCCAHQGKLEDVMNILIVQCWMYIDPECVRDTLRLTDCIHLGKRAEYQCHLVVEDVVKTCIAWELYMKRFEMLTVVCVLNDLPTNDLFLSTYWGSKYSQGLGIEMK